MLGMPGSIRFGDPVHRLAGSSHSVFLPRDTLHDLIRQPLGHFSLEALDLGPKLRIGFHEIGMVPMP